MRRNGNVQFRLRIRPPHHPQRRQQMNRVAQKAEVENHDFLCIARALEKIRRAGVRHWKKFSANGGANKFEPPFSDRNGARATSRTGAASKPNSCHFFRETLINFSDEEGINADASIGRLVDVEAVTEIPAFDDRFKLKKVVPVVIDAHEQGWLLGANGLFCSF